MLQHRFTLISKEQESRQIFTEKIMENIYKEVDFETYCETCEHKDLKENFDPCNDCLGEPMNANSEKPVYWKEADNGR